MQQLEMLETTADAFCLTCKKVKHTKEFGLGYISKNKNGKCKECRNEESRALYAKNKEKYKQKLIKYRAHNKTKTRAMKNLQYALQSGKLTRQPCEVCGEEKADAHHDDYAKPLEVRWLCRRHHIQWHRHNGEALNAFTVRHWTPPKEAHK